MVDFKKIKVWEYSHQLTKKLYQVTKSFPKSEQYNLVSQIRRASTSIPTNIAEGCGRETQKELKRFLYIASGSAHEVEYLLLLSSDLGYIDADVYKERQSEIIIIKKMLAKFISKVNENIK